MDKYGAAEGGLMNTEPKRKRDPKKAKLHEMTVRRGHKGGYITKHTEHRHKDGQMEHDHPSRGAEFPIATEAELQKHMHEHMGEESGEIAEENQGGEGEGGEAEGAAGEQEEGAPRQ